VHRDELKDRFSAYFSYPVRDAVAIELTFLRDRSSEDWRRVLEHAEVLGANRATSSFALVSEIAPSTSSPWKSCFEMSAEPSTRTARSSRVPVIGEIAFLDGRPRSATITGRNLKPTS
jgi:hypothetical protein